MNNIDYETIISSFDDKGTLLKWLKTIDAELKGAKVTSSSWRVVEGEESNTAYLTLTTSDGVSFETEGLVMPKVTSAIIIDVINQAIKIYDEHYDGAQTLQEFVEHVESDLEDHSTELGNLGIKLNSVGATNGQVLTSNGDGTSAWKDASGGSKLYLGTLKPTGGEIKFVTTSNSPDINSPVLYIKTSNFGGFNGPANNQIMNGLIASRGGLYLIINYLDLTNNQLAEYSTSIRSATYTEL